MPELNTVVFTVECTGEVAMGHVETLVRELGFQNIFTCKSGLELNHRTFKFRLDHDATAHEPHLSWLLSRHPDVTYLEVAKRTSL